MGTWYSYSPAYESGSPISNVRFPMSTAPVSSIASLM